MQPSDALLHFLMQPDMENVKLTAYADSGGVPTIGMGHTLGVTLGMTCTLQQAMNWARRDMAGAAATVSQLLRTPIAAGKVAQNHFDAFTSLGFNIGNGNLRKASAVAYYLTGDLPTAAAHMLLWDKDSAGATLDGLLKRRNCEAMMLLGQPWRIPMFANEFDPNRNTATLTRCMAAYA